MLGNAWEWVTDWYAPNAYGGGSMRIDPIGPENGEVRIRRGGSYHCPAVETRSAFREANLPTTRYTVTGFRVVVLICTEIRSNRDRYLHSALTHLR